MRLIVIVLASLVICQPALAQTDAIWDSLPPEVRSTLDDQSDQLHALTFGWCFDEVRGVPRRSDFIDPYEADWIDDFFAENTNGQQYAQPRMSPDQTVFVDLFPNGVSCFIQFESMSTPYLMQAIVAELLDIPGLETVDVDQSEVGRNSRRFFIPADEGGFASLMQIHAYFSPQRELVIIIIRRDQ